ncbi:MAG: 1-acyl-sn-glycerol-3-phosphate acyltransferase [Candidatus Rhabdochlamydia sp.]
MNFNFIQQSMENSSTFNLALQDMHASEWLLEQTKEILSGFFQSYSKALSEEGDKELALKNFKLFLELIKKECLSPHTFDPYHIRIKEPFDYYTFGIEFIAPLVDIKHSKVIGHSHLKQIQEQIQAGDNVVFLANHQIEADPQALSILLDSTYPGFAEEMIFVAGERVITDPVAIPFSLGRNLLCIYSKRYINHPPEKKLEKQLHNKRTMEKMSQLFQEGGKVIYVAPSGGRDRLNSKGIVEVAPFDPSTIELFFLMAQKAKRKTHFYPMSLLTYDLLPPPKTIQLALGEKREVRRSSIHLAIGEEIVMEAPQEMSPVDKKLYREQRAQKIWETVNTNYQLLLNQKR